MACPDECWRCGREYLRTRHDARFCSKACRISVKSACRVEACTNMTLRWGAPCSSCVRGKVPGSPRSDHDGWTHNAAGYVTYGKGGRNSPILQHRVIMEWMLGRELRPGETVHHKNGIKDDNRPENLELFVVAQPKGQRPEDLAEWVVRTYPELVKAVLAENAIKVGG